MPRSAGGVYTLTAGTPYVTGTIISSAVVNTLNTDLALALTQSVASTGVTTPTANLPMGTYRHTGVGNATAQACYGSVTDIQNGSLVTLSAVAGTNTITANAPLTLAAYAANQFFRLIPAVTNTGATTINISALGAKNVYINGAACTGGELVANVPVGLFYDGTQFHVIETGAIVTRTGVETLTRKTLTNPTVTNYVETLYAPVAGSAWTVDLANGTVQEFITNANATITLPSSVGGKSYLIIVKYGGAHTLTWAGGGTLKWAGSAAPSATSTNGKYDIFVFTCDGTNTFGRSGGIAF